MNLLLQEGNLDEDMETDCSDFESEDEGPQQPSKARRTGGGAASGGGAGAGQCPCPACCFALTCCVEKSRCSSQSWHAAQLGMHLWVGRRCADHVACPVRLMGSSNMYRPTTSIQVSPGLD